MNALKQMREAAGLTQQDLAVKAGMQTSQVSRLERGVISLLNMTVRTALAMSKALGIPCAEFIETLQIENKEDE